MKKLLALLLCLSFVLSASLPTFGITSTLTSIKLRRATVALQVGTNYPISPILLPASTHAKLTYTSSDLKIAKVSTTGIVMPLKAGKVTITVTGVENKKLTAKLTANITVPNKAHMDISLAIWDIGNAFPEGVKDPMYDYLAKKFNISIIPKVITWDDSQTKIQLWAASGQLPDMFCEALEGTPTLQNFINQGIVKQIPEDLSAYPDLEKVVNNPDLSYMLVPMGDPKAKAYGIPRTFGSDTSDMANSRAFIYRKDWMKLVGIKKEPTNVDELIAMAKAFQTKDPGKLGNGKTIGISAFSANFIYMSLMLSFEPVLCGIGNWTRDVKNPGSWMYAGFTDNAKKGVLAIKKIYDAGVIDEDVFTFKGEEGEDKVANGLVGIYATNGANPSILNRIYQKWNKNFPNKKFEDSFEIMHPFKALDGKYYMFKRALASSQTYINNNCSPEKLDRILKYMDYSFSEKGFRFLSFGFEGKDFKMENGQVVDIRPLKADGTIIDLKEKYPFTWIANMIPSWIEKIDYSNPAIPKNILKMSLTELNWRKKNAISPNTDFKINYISYPGKARFVTKGNEDITKAILNADTAATWDQINADHRKAGYDNATKQINEAAKAINLK